MSKKERTKPVYTCPHCGKKRHTLYRVFDTLTGIKRWICVYCKKDERFD